MDTSINTRESRNPMPHLSIVIPAYNEEKRLPKTLERMFPYVRSLGYSFEIVIVDDGSTDRTVAVLQEVSTKYPELRIVSDGINRGRGAAVKKGIFEARGDLVLETDSDGSVADEAIGRFVARFDAERGIDAIFGSRQMRGAVVAVHQPFVRVFLGYGFIFLTKLLFLMWRTTDFTLGFKMFRRDVARDIFNYQFDPFFVAEAELVFVAKIRGHHAIEMPVTWVNDEDSRVHPVRDTFRSLRGLAEVLVRYFYGSYT